MSAAEIDKETLSIMTRYCGSDPRVRRQATINVLDEYGGDVWPLAEFTVLIGDAVDKIPEECRGTAVVELEGGYEESTHFTIRYTRPETDTEVAARVTDAAKYASELLAHERKELERLRKKFGL